MAICGCTRFSPFSWIAADKRGGGKISQRKAHLTTSSEKDQPYIDKFWSSEENWFHSAYGYSLVGAAFSKAFLNDKKSYESLFEFAQRYNIRIPMLHKYGTNSGNPTLNTMEEIARAKGINLFEFFGFTPTEIKRAFARIGLDYETERARSERINSHPEHVAFKKEGPRAKLFQVRRPELADALRGIESKASDPAELIAVHGARNRQPDAGLGQRTPEADGDLASEHPQAPLDVAVPHPTARLARKRRHHGGAPSRRNRSSGV